MTSGDREPDDDDSPSPDSRAGNRSPREPVSRAIDNLKLSESTATGEAIFAALQSIQTLTDGPVGVIRGGDRLRSC